MYYSRQISLTVVSPSVDFLIALTGAVFFAALPLVSTLLSRELTHPKYTIAVVSVTVLSGLGLVVWGLTHWVVRGLDPLTSLNVSGGALVLNLSFLAQRLTPAMLLLVVLVCLVTVISGKTLLSAVPSARSETLSAKLRTVDYALLFAILISSIAIAGYPYWRNPGWIVGTDAYWLYRDPLLRVLSTGSSDVLRSLSRERHPFYIGLLYILNRTTQLGADATIVLAQIGSASLWVVASWILLAPSVTRTRTTLTAALAAVSSQVQIGMFTSILAQWLALILMALYFAVVFLSSGLRLRRLAMPFLALISSAILLLHPWTWGFFLLLVVGYVLLTHHVRDACPAKSVVISLVFPLLLLAGLLLVSPELASDFSLTLGLYARAFAAMNLGVLVNGLGLFFNQFSVFFSWVILSLAIFGATGLNMKRPEDRLVVVWMILGVTSMLLLSGIGRSMTKPFVLEPQSWRGFFLLPLFFLAGAGLSRLSLLGSDSKDGSPALAYQLTMLAAGVGVAAALIPSAWIAPLLLFLSIFSSALIVRASQRQGLTLLGPVLLVFLFALALTQNMIALSQLLLDPHNYRT